MLLIEMDVVGANVKEGSMVCRKTSARLLGSDGAAGRKGDKGRNTDTGSVSLGQMEVNSSHDPEFGQTTVEHRDIV